MATATNKMKSYTASQVAELDRHTIEDLGVDIKQLMLLSEPLINLRNLRSYGGGRGIRTLDTA